MVFIPTLQEIKQRREALELTQRKLADLCKIRASFLNMIENGKAKPSYDVLVNIFNILDEQAEKAIKNIKTASKMCSKNLITLGKHATLEEAAKIMKNKNYSQIPVEDKSGCLGLVTENSILRYQLENGADSLSKAKSVDAMEAPPPIIGWNQPMTPRILDLLYDTTCLLVSKDGKLVAMITKIDAIRGIKK